MSKLKQNKGFTLIELLVALAIVGIILLAFFRAIDTTTKMNVKNDRDIKALNIAQSEIENLRNQIKNYGQLENIEIKDIINILKNEIGYEGNQNNENVTSIIIPFQKIPETIYEEENEDENNIYEVIYTKSIDKKKFNIYLDISQSKVNNEKIKVENASKSKDTGIYLYTINIKVKSLDDYFSTKETEIQDVKILSKNKS